jgi:hypothetical protein
MVDTILVVSAMLDYCFGFSPEGDSVVMHLSSLRNCMVLEEAMDRLASGNILGMFHGRLLIALHYAHLAWSVSLYHFRRFPISRKQPCII